MPEYVSIYDEVCVGYVRVLNISEFSIFVNFRKYDKVMNMSRDVIMKEFWIFYDLEYARFLHMQALRKILDMPEHGWIMLCGRVLKMPDQRFTGF